MSDEIWDGNGGILDAKTAPQRDLLVALHVKMDQVVIPKLNDLDDRMRFQENGHLTPGQAAAVRLMLEGVSDRILARRSSKATFWALGIAIVGIVLSVVLTLTVSGP